MSTPACEYSVTLYLWVQYLDEFMGLLPDPANDAVLFNVLIKTPNYT